LHLDREFNEESFSMHQMDAIVMEKLTASPYIVDSFGFCGQSVMTNFARSSGRNLIKDPALKWLTRLKLARDLARGLADLHALTPLSYKRNNLTTHRNRQSALVFAHHDVNIANTIAIDSDRIQWNDFNLGIIARHQIHNYTNHSQYSPCPVPIRYEGPLWRSPEEIQNQTGYLSPSGNAMQAADVYSLGNILFQVATKHQPWSHLEEDDGSKAGAKKDDWLVHIANAKSEGRLPNMPERYLSRKESQILWQAIQRCYRQNPSARPTAFDLALKLGEVYDHFYKKAHKNATESSSGKRQLK
jgi:serine/threonine protein kinase